MALWRRKKPVVVETEQKDEMKPVGKETVQPALRKQITATSPPAAKNNNGAISEPSLPKIQRIIPPQATRTLTVVKYPNVVSTTLASPISTRKTTAAATAKSVPETAQTKLNLPGKANLPKDNAKKVISSVTYKQDKLDPKSNPVNPNKETSPVLKTVASCGATVGINSKPSGEEKTISAAPVEEKSPPPPERSFSK